MSVQRFDVEVTGVGWKDYSQDVQISTAPFIRGRQLRVFHSTRYSNLAALTWPDAYEAMVGFLVDTTLQNAAPLRPYLFYLISAVADRNALVAISFVRYNSYADYLSGVIAEYLGTAYGYGKAVFELVKGVAAQHGSVYSVLFGEYSGDVFNLHVTLHALIGGVEEIE